MFNLKLCDTEVVMRIKLYYRELMASHIMQILEQFRAQGIGDNYVLLKINLYRYNGIAKCYKTVRPTKDSERVYNKI
jgi:hypothetical protein